jgi:basic amino acid/polyamine antiporter, APA family
MAVVSIVSLLASISAMTFAGPRVYFAMGRDGVFFKQAASVHARYKTPAVSILAQATWSSMLVLTAGADALVTYTGFAIVLFSGVAVVALFVLRTREPNSERPFRAWGYPVAPAIYVIASALILINGLMNDPKTTGFGAIVILLGVPLFLLFRGNKQRF